MGEIKYRCWSLNFIPYKQIQMLEDYYLDNYEVKMVRFVDMTLLAQGQVHLMIKQNR